MKPISHLVPFSLIASLRVSQVAWLLCALGMAVFVRSFGAETPPKWEIATLAGTGEAGYSGDGGPATQAKINNPYGVIRGADGSVFFCDMDNHVIRRIDGRGVITTVAGTGKRGSAGEGGPAIHAELNEPYEIRFDGQSNLVFVEMKGAVIRRIDRNSGILRTIAGTGREGFSGDNGPAIHAEFRQPHSIQFDRAGRLYVCDIGNHRLRRVGNDGTIETVAGTGSRDATPDGAPLVGTALNGPRAVDFDQKGRLWLALREGNAVYRTEDAAPIWRWKHAAGTGAKGFSGNGGDARTAQLSGPKGISISPEGDVYLADTESHTIRVIRSRTGRIECVVGDGTKGVGREGDPLSCRLNRPHGIFAEINGSVLIGDSENHRVLVLRRKAAPK